MQQGARLWAQLGDTLPRCVRAQRGEAAEETEGRWRTGKEPKGWSATTLGKQAFYTYTPEGEKLLQSKDHIIWFSEGAFPSQSY